MFTEIGELDEELDLIEIDQLKPSFGLWKNFMYSIVRLKWHMITTGNEFYLNGLHIIIPFSVQLGFFVFFLKFGSFR